MSVSVSALRGPRPAGFAGDGTPRDEHAAGPGGPARAPQPQARLVSPEVARVVTLLALTAFGALHWMAMLEPAAAFRAAYAVLIGGVVSGVLLAAGRAAGPRRAGLLALAVVGGVALALLAGGVHDEDLRPDNWGALATEIGGGLSALPGARIPYRGLDEQLRLVIPIGGTLLVLLGALLACWPRRGTRAGRLGFPVPALIALVTLYAVPAVSLILDAEFLRGALLALLVIAFLRLDRLRPRDAPAALGVAGVAAVLALMAAPALDTATPWFDYEDWAQNAASAKSTTFNWNHSYGPLTWPRDGRELLRIKSPQRSYWKTDTLDVFDGRHWVANQGAYGIDDNAVLFSGVDVRRLARWTYDLRVTVRNLRSPTLPLAGSADVVAMPGRDARQLRPGVWTVGRPIHRGDAYRVESYLPQPSAQELRTAGEAYGFELQPYTSVTAIPTRGPAAGRSMRIWADGFFGGDPKLRDFHDVPVETVIADSNLRRAYRLSRRLLGGASTPYEYVRAVERYLDDGFGYSENPPPGSRTLDGFLFDTKLGYCQHFSGAMALLLRLGGIPARVATGFAPGSYDKKNKEYVVRDLDAHSWVEAYFPGVGWVTFDPTPAAAPPRSQALAGAATAARGDIRDVGTTQVSTIATPAPAKDVPWAAIVLGALAVLLTGLGARRLWRRRGLPRPPAISELERALRGAGDPVPTGLTLRELEGRFRRSAPVAAYIAALRAERYAPGGGGPTPAQRRGLRRALARGRGPVVRARTWWALPPRIRPQRQPR